MDSGATGLVLRMEHIHPAVAEKPIACPNCLRADALIAIGGELFCAACGYASSGGAGCT